MLQEVRGSFDPFTTCSGEGKGFSAPCHIDHLDSGTSDDDDYYQSLGEDDVCQNESVDEEDELEEIDPDVGLDASSSDGRPVKNTREPAWMRDPQWIRT